MRRRLDAVVFDWGGTLTVDAEVDLADLWRVAAHHLAGGREDQEERLVQLLLRIEEATWARVVTDQVATTLDRILDEACRASGLDVRAAVRAEAAAHHLDRWAEHVRHRADALATLQALQDAGYRCGLLSNTHWPRAWHQRILERDGLDGYLDATTYTSELPHVKPHPSAFKAVLHALDVPDPRRAAFVGDRLFDDVWGASRLGMWTAHLPTSATWPEGTIVREREVRPDAVLAELGDVLRWVADWS